MVSEKSSLGIGLKLNLLSYWKEIASWQIYAILIFLSSYKLPHFLGNRLVASKFTTASSTIAIPTFLRSCSSRNITVVMVTLYNLTTYVCALILQQFTSSDGS